MLFIITHCTLSYLRSQWFTIYTALMYLHSITLNAAQSTALSLITGGTSLFLSVALLVHNFHFRLEGRKTTTYFIKPSYVQYKRLCHKKSYFVKINDFIIKTISCPIFCSYKCVHMCIMNLNVHGMCICIFRCSF